LEISITYLSSGAHGGSQQAWGYKPINTVYMFISSVVNLLALFPDKILLRFGTLNDSFVLIALTYVSISYSDCTCSIVIPIITPPLHAIRFENMKAASATTSLFTEIKKIPSVLSCCAYECGSCQMRNHPNEVCMYINMLCT
jgi:hypothetical protein